MDRLIKPINALLTKSRQNTFLALSIGIVYLWFGTLKFFPPFESGRRPRHGYDPFIDLWLPSLPYRHLPACHDGGGHWILFHFEHFQEREHYFGIVPHGLHLHAAFFLCGGIFCFGAIGADSFGTVHRKEPDHRCGAFIHAESSGEICGRCDK